VSRGIGFAERGLAPDFAIRIGIRGLLADRLREAAAGPEVAALAREMRDSPVALVPDVANAQHYELPAAFFELVLGTRLKYSSGLWDGGVTRLDDAETAMLQLTAERAGLADGQEILDLGCGWGSLALWMAERYPNSRILGVSNSPRQREFIMARAPGNLEILTADMNSFGTGRRFDRVVSVEMFEHIRNWPALLHRIAGWMGPEARLFLHVFCHRQYAYPFEADGESDWMGRHFFSGGLMPSWDLLDYFPDDLRVEDRWPVPGSHYQKTCEAWLRRLDARRSQALPLLEATYGPDQAERWFHRWRMFFLACAELFGYRGGSEWFVGHYRLRRA